MAERENTGAKIQSGNGGLSVRSGLSGNELKVIAIIAMAADHLAWTLWPGYANKEWWSTKLTDSRFDKWDKWVAQHGSNCEYDKEYNVWQYTDKGTVNGIPGNADVNMHNKFCSICKKMAVCIFIIQELC